MEDKPLLGKYKFTPYERESIVPKLTQEPVVYVEATPDREYPIRILKAHRKNCDCDFVDNTAEAKNKSPLIDIMNGLNKDRAKILDRAIKILEKYL